MSGYQSLDLTQWTNVGPKWVEQEQQAPIPDWPPAAGDFPRGLQQFHGIPFQIGEEGNNSPFMGFGRKGHQRSVTVPIKNNLRWMIFAHRLLETHLHEGEDPGREIARYKFHFVNGEVVSVPVRERFEISVVPAEWGQWPVLAVPDTADRLLPRDKGRWEDFGLRLTDVEYVYPKWFVLWAWRNPFPESELASLQIEPIDRPFLIAGITGSSLEEAPFGRTHRQPVIITMKDQGQEGDEFDVAIELDRGISTYLYHLPAESKDQFLKDSFRGWGQPYNNQSKKSYVEIDARPSAKLLVKKDEDEVIATQWQEVIESGQVETSKARIELVDREKNWVHVQVLDEDTGEPVPCRVHFRSPEGVPYQPHGHHNHLLSDKTTWNMDVGGDVRLGHVTYAYIDGKCQGWLPRGEVLVDISRGFEYEPMRQSVNIHREQRELTLHLKRWTNMKENRWFSGDTHVHFLSTMGALLEGSGEDLDVVNLLQSQWGHHFSNIEDFIGQPVQVPGRSTVVYTSQENRQHILGHLILLGLQEQIVPWCTGGADEAEISGTLETTLSHWADECHDQDGTVIIPHFPMPNSEAAVLIATNRADAVEMIWHDMYSHFEYYRYLNAGYKLPLVGCTDKMTAEVPVGINRSYVYIPENEPFNYANWCKHLGQGRTFITTGPMLNFTVDGAQVGDTVQLSGNGGTVEITAEAEGIFPIHTLEIVQGGKVVAATEEPEGARRLVLSTKITVDHNTWLAARVGGPRYKEPLRHFDPDRRGVMAHTSPIYISVGDEWWMSNDQTKQYMLTMVHAGLEHIRQQSRQYPPGSVLHHHGESDHVAYLERPFHEAIRLLNKRK